MFGEEEGVIGEVEGEEWGGGGGGEGGPSDVDVEVYGGEVVVLVEGFLAGVANVVDGLGVSEMWEGDEELVVGEFTDEGGGCIGG